MTSGAKGTSTSCWPIIGRPSTPKRQLINSADASKCGVFNKEADYPYQLYTSVGNCTFNDPKQEKNTDSIYGRSDFAYTCDPSRVGDINDDIYTIVRHSTHF
jgi:hypothetical protein